MDYEIVKLKEAKIAGLKARTNNTAADMPQVIGGLWRSFYEDGIYESIEGKIDNKALGIYTEYAGKEMDDYTVMVAYRVEQTDVLPEKVCAGIIPAGTYAKFVVRGDMRLAVAEFWKELWKMDLPRNFVCDFEEYQDGGMEEAEIHIYIGLKD